MSLEFYLKEMERSKEAYWRRYPSTSPTKLRWRALTVRHCFHVLPGESILELGAGTGLWTEHLALVFRGENPITSAVFNKELLECALRRRLNNVGFVHVENLMSDLPAASFDYVIGNKILCHNRYRRNLRAIYRLLKPGGQILFFEDNSWNLYLSIRRLVRRVTRQHSNARCQIDFRRHKLMHMASQQGFTHVEAIPYDIIPPSVPGFAASLASSVAFLFEHTPAMRELCGTFYIWAVKPHGQVLDRLYVNLATHHHLFGSTSVVVPCHNEAMNIPRLVSALLEMYRPYIHEIIIVDDNSSDRTAAVVREIAKKESLVRLIGRQPPNGVGRALRDGYAAATGRYILTMDCDFALLVPELRDLFDAVAAGHDGAVGSRFSHESILINYPFFKVICNRGFHWLANMLLRTRVRDVSNNLKLYRSEILKGLDIRANHFAANAETGLKPLLAGHDIKEVSVSWINRTNEMGDSSFSILKTAPGYVLALLRIVFESWRHFLRPDKLRKRKLRS